MTAIAGTLAVTCPVCTALAASEKPHWSYQGEGGPEHWGKLSDDYQVCGLGTQQSPVDLADTAGADLSPPALTWPVSGGKVINNGHTIQVNLPKGGSLALDGRRFSLLQFHFHHPSEHLIDGRAYGMEVHFVHASESGDLAVVGAMIEPGTEHPALAAVWSAMPKTAGGEADLAREIDPVSFLPGDNRIYRYAGSLTTPPCSEIVAWTVYRTAIQASPQQIAAFAALFPNNARPAQAINRRFLLRSF